MYILYYILEHVLAILQLSKVLDKKSHKSLR